ncbi:MAG: protein-L-isoaspartate O-methyltransferase [Thiotrichaceae bacterium IS1]|nr:MAG: protein-L-isoaspartate O-methyltransferase [Thiotrichaceae bacterium IS1]
MTQLNFEQARFNMIEQQIRPWEVLDQRILDLLLQVPREEFVPTTYRNLAFADISVPLAHDQVMMAPKVEGRLLQSLMLTLTDRILEIGTGSAFMTALLAKSAQQVDSVDIFPDFVQEAAVKLKAIDVTNVTLAVGDAANGWQLDTRYDVVILTGSVPVLKSHFQEQLNLGGRLFAIVGEDPAMQAQLITRISEQEWYVEVLFETSVPPLIGAPQPERFIF